MEVPYSIFWLRGFYHKLIVHSWTHHLQLQSNAQKCEGPKAFFRGMTGASGGLKQALQWANLILLSSPVKSCNCGLQKFFLSIAQVGAQDSANCGPRVICAANFYCTSGLKKPDSNLPPPLSLLFLFQVNSLLVRARIKRNVSQEHCR